MTAEPALDVYRIALLAQGTNGPCDTATVTLVVRGLLRVDPRAHGFGRFHAHGMLPADVHPIERAVHEAAAREHRQVMFEALHDWGMGAYHARERAGKLNRRQAEIGRSMEAQGPRGLSAQGATGRNLRYALRRDTAQMREHLIEAGLLRLGRLVGSRPTPEGREVIEELHRRHAVLRQPGQVDAAPVPAVALWGVTALKGTRLEVIYEAIYGRPDPAGAT